MCWEVSHHELKDEVARILIGEMLHTEDLWGRSRALTQLLTQLHMAYRGKSSTRVPYAVREAQAGVQDLCSVPNSFDEAKVSISSPVGSCLESPFCEDCVMTGNWRHSEPCLDLTQLSVAPLIMVVYDAHD